MKQVVANLSTGECRVEDVPAPGVRDGCVVVRNDASVISTGTEGGTAKLAQMSLLGKARARPEQVRKVIEVARTRGPLVAYQAARRSLEMPVLMGYGCAGEVIAVGAGVSDLQVGERVACAGPGHANHAEVVCVPRNLCAPVPREVESRHAAFTALGSIALQGVRISEARLGENVVVIGLGLVGLLSAQVLRAAGCNVFGVDVDPRRVEWVKEKGLCDGALSGDTNLKEQVEAFTGGLGADSVIITASSENNAPVALAGELARYRGRVVVLGRTEMSAPRDTYLFKELELRTSLAYGPGTGDPSYELQGLDYPAGYVRWTENRNMIAFLELAARGSSELDDLVTHELPVEDAARAFDIVTGKAGEACICVMLRYPNAEANAPEHRIGLATRPPLATTAGVIRVGVVGAGSFATNEFLPLLGREAKGGSVELRGIASATGVRAQALGRKYGFAFCASEAADVIEDPETDCVFILTRHDTHAPLTAAALEAGRHVFVEKPLALTHEQLDRVEEALHGSDRQLMVGFNRRYAPLAVRLSEFFASRAQPLSILYRANVGYRPPEHWLHDPREGGGVILGEACHHIDFCNWLIGDSPEEVSVHRLEGADSGILSQDNVHVTLRYADGSLATVAYLSNGSRGFGIERVEVHGDNRSATLTEFQKLELSQGLRTRRARLWLGPDRGHAAQIAAFLAAVRDGTGDLDTALYLRSSRAAIDAGLAASGSGPP